ncbi:LOW QUALITY PROTEIN: sarcospan [Struthio camelus]
MWHFDLRTIRSKRFPYLFALLDSNTGNNPASTKRSCAVGGGGAGWGEKLARPWARPRQELGPASMGRKEKRAPRGDTSRGNRSQAGQAAPGQETSGSAATRKEEEGARGDPKTGRAEETPACCGCRFPLLLALLQLALGTAVAVLGFLAAGVSSSLLVRDTPHWAGIIVCVVSLVGFVMLCISYQPDEKTCVQFTVKLMYFLLSALGLVVCVLAVAFAAHHYLQMTQFTCDTVLESCQCKVDTADPLGRTFVYQDAADCGSVTSTLHLYLLLQMVLNVIAAIVCLAACFVMWKHRYQVFYVGVRFYPLTATEGQQQKV